MSEFSEHQEDFVRELERIRDAAAAAGRDLGRPRRARKASTRSEPEDDEED